MPPIDDEAFWKTLVDCKASRYLTAGEVQFLLLYRANVEVRRAEQERRAAELDYVSRMLALMGGASPPTEEALTKLLERQPPREASDVTVKAFVAALRLFVNRAGVRESLAAAKHRKVDQGSAINADMIKKALRKVDSKTYADAVEGDLRCCHKLLAGLQNGDDVHHQVVEDVRPLIKQKRPSISSQVKVEAGGMNESVLLKLYPLEKLMHTHPACERLSEDAAFKTANLENKIKYLLDALHSKEAVQRAPLPEPVESRDAATSMHRDFPASQEEGEITTDLPVVKHRQGKKRAGKRREVAILPRDEDASSSDQMDALMLVEPDATAEPSLFGTNASRRTSRAADEWLGRRASESQTQTLCDPMDGQVGGQNKAPSAKTEREMLLYIAEKIQDEWAHIFRDLMDDASVPLDDFQAMKVEIEHNYEGKFVQACQCLEKWQQASGAFNTRQLQRILESKHRKDLATYVEGRVNRGAQPPTSYQ